MYTYIYSQYSRTAIFSNHAFNMTSVLHLLRGLDLSPFSRAPRTKHNSTVSNGKKIDCISPGYAPLALHAPLTNVDLRERNDSAE